MENINDSKDTKWLDDNSYKSQLMGTCMIPYRPDFGFYVKVFDLDISEDIFRDEFNKIQEAYFSVIHKMDTHYKELNKSIPINTNII